jgi:hypothetical protein
MTIHQPVTAAPETAGSNSATAAVEHNWAIALATFEAADAAAKAQWTRVKAEGEDPAVATLCADDDALVEARADAYDVLLLTQPPSAAALAHKELLHSIECDDNRVGFGNPSYVQDPVNAPFVAMGAAQFYRDALGLAGLVG